MPIPVWHGSTKEGKLTLKRREAFEKYLRSLAGKDIEIIVRVPNKARTLRQNSYFHAIVAPMIGDAAGYTAEEAKIILKKHFGVKHTATLTTRQFATFIDQCIQLAAETYEIAIPDPKDVEF